MQFGKILAVLSTLVIVGCSSSGDSTASAETFDLRSAIVTGADESSTTLWNCVFDNRDDPTAEQAMNTVTFWENGRGINGSGRLYDWTITSDDRLDGTYDGGDRLLALEGFTFTSDNNNFTALNISTLNVGTAEEDVRNFDATCNRIENP